MFELNHFYGMPQIWNVAWASLWVSMCLFIWQTFKTFKNMLSWKVFERCERVMFWCNASDTTHVNGLLGTSQYLSSPFSVSFFFKDGNKTHKCHTSGFVQNMSGQTQCTQTDTSHLKMYLICPTRVGIPLCSTPCCWNTMTCSCCLSKVVSFSCGWAFRGLSGCFQTFLCN